MQEERAGKAEVERVYQFPDRPNIAGCVCREGAIGGSDRVRVVRAGRVIHQGEAGRLHAGSGHTDKACAGDRFGIQLQGVEDFKEGDIIEVAASRSRC